MSAIKEFETQLNGSRDRIRSCKRKIDAKYKITISGAEKIVIALTSSADTFEARKNVFEGKFEKIKEADFSDENIKNIYLCLKLFTNILIYFDSKMKTYKEVDENVAITFGPIRIAASNVFRKSKRVEYEQSFRKYEEIFKYMEKRIEFIEEVVSYVLNPSLEFRDNAVEKF